MLHQERLRIERGSSVPGAEEKFPSTRTYLQERSLNTDCTRSSRPLRTWMYYSASRSTNAYVSSSRGRRMSSKSASSVRTCSPEPSRYLRLVWLLPASGNSRNSGLKRPCLRQGRSVPAYATSRWTARKGLPCMCGAICEFSTPFNKHSRGFIW